MPPYELSLDAEKDLRTVVKHTLTRWGAAQVREYMQALERCMEALATEFGHYKTLHEVHPALRVKHCQHHYVFGLIRDAAPMRIIAVFHERMDLMARLESRLN